MKIALATLSLTLASSLSMADISIDTDAIMSGLEETKLIFSCEHPDAKVMFKITKEARAEVMYTLDAEGKLVAEQNLQSSGKLCPNNSQIEINEYCVQPVCIIKDVRPPIEPNSKLSRAELNSAQLAQKPVSIDEIF